MSPLPTVENSLRRPRRGALPLVAALATSIQSSSGTGGQRCLCSGPRWFIKALNADDGKEIWSVSLAEKMAGSLKSLHYFLAV